jgi:hypothetical protein
MSNSYRIRTQVGVDKAINVHLEQDFESLEILSLKILQSEIYTRQCADYGVVIGRISINNGFGLPNCKVSIFVPLATEDENNPIVSAIYPYKTVSDINDVGYRYNLLPYVQSYSAHVPTGSFFDKEDVLINQSFIEVFDKYYKFTAVTNESGDFMIFGVPIGVQTIHVDVDLSDIGEFSLAPQDLIRTGLATEAQVSGTRFKSSSNLNELPQIVSLNRTITIEPLWGQPDVCNIGINRTDFDLSAEANVVIEPTAIFMGSIFSDVENLALKRNCRPKVAQGELCSLVTGPGEILALRQTIFEDDQGRPILEQYELESGGKVIDDNGTWLVDLPMNLDFVTTNEFGERVFSNDPEVGIPTRGKYRFKIKWNQSPSLDENVKRAYFLVPNVREYGWSSTGLAPTNPILQKKSYAFSLDWDDYADPQVAINCEDTFYQFSYNKVYTISQLIDQYRNGTIANRIVSIKNILDNSCESENNKFPTNDASFRWDIIFLLYTLASYIFRPILVALVPVLHVLFFLIILLRVALIPLLITYLSVLLFIALPIKIFGAAAGVVSAGMVAGFVAEGVGLIAAIFALGVVLRQLRKLKLRGINLPLLLYDQCEFCSCKDSDNLSEDGVNIQTSSTSLTPPPPPLPNASGIQITNFEGGSYNTDKIEDDINYNYYNLLLSGYYVKYPPRKPTGVSKTPYPINGVYASLTDGDITAATYRTRSITTAERINLFNLKAKYFDEAFDNPNGGINQVYVSIEPTLNGGGYSYNNNPTRPYLTPGNYHTDNVVVLMMTPDSLSSLPIGTLLSFVSPNTTKDINYSGGTLNEFQNNAITGTSYLNLTNPGATQVQINVPFTLPDGSLRTTIYTIPQSDGSSTGNTNCHKFPTDIEYFQVITAMTYSDFSTQANLAQFYAVLGGVPVLGQSLKNRFLDNDTFINIEIGDFLNQRVETIPSLRSLQDYEKNIIVILQRGVDPYTTRVETKFDLGRIFGVADPTLVSVQGKYHLNIPVQGGFFNVSHSNLISDISQLDSYSNSQLYYTSYDYIPAPNPSQQTFSAFTSNLPHYYSSLDNSNILSVDWTNCPLPQVPEPRGGAGFQSSKGASIGSDQNVNQHIIEYNVLIIPNVYAKQNLPTNVLNSSSQNRGYYPNEIVEGGSYMTIGGDIGRIGSFQFFGTLIIDSGTGQPQTYESSRYVSPMYFSGINWNYTTTQFQSRKLVMRSDRLPTSDRLLQNCDTYYTLQQNQNLGMYIIPDEGTFDVPLNVGATFGSQPYEDDTEIPNFTAELLRSTNNCSDSRNLGCYEFDANLTLRDGTNPGGGDYIINSGNCQKYLGKQVFENGCYKLVTTVFGSLVYDLGLVTEWLSRLNITFGACRNVFSHLFTHNWINGTLYAFAFKNNKTTDISGNDIPVFCPALIYYDSDTNNFYYRSSPYGPGSSPNTFGFLGRTASYLPNRKNLLFPTTIMDLGPRNDYLQELVFSDEYDGYVMNRLSSTSYQDVSELLNLLIITRLANTSFIAILVGANGGSIFEYFTRVPLFSVNQRLNVDADYAQMISINSELGVVPFESSAYPNTTPPPGVPVVIDPVYFNTGEFGDTIFGIFYSSDTQVRDFITPKRTIINNQALANDNCAFNNFYCYSQEVPFYQWEIKDNENTPNLNSIFGSQKNDWYSNSIDNSLFHSFKYQSMDRANSLSRYFRTNTSLFVGDRKGYIYSIDTRINPPAGPYTSPFYVTPSLNPLNNSWDVNNPDNNLITVGAPFYFYFGLKKGASAWDRFAKKWINTERIQ